MDRLRRTLRRFVLEAALNDPRKKRIAERMRTTRRDTLALLDRVSEADLRRRVHLFYSPVGWHFGHIGRTEECWTVGGGTDDAATDDRLAFLFADRPDNPKENRANLPPREEIVRFLAVTRERSFEALERGDLDTPGLYQDGYAWLFADQHERQHQETIAELLFLLRRDGLAPSDALALPPRFDRATMIEIPGGEFEMGAATTEAYDNEREPHRVVVGAFRLAREPVTVAEWAAFIADGGYRRADLWTREGWAWREAEPAVSPMYWTEGGVVTLAGVRPPHPDEPVMGVSAHEADAFARWRGARLPTESEWEYAAARAGGPFPWGSEPPTPSHAAHAIVGLGPRPVGEANEGDTPDRVRGLAGNVWEWTSSAFLPYPGFRAFPYDGYSKTHMQGAHRVVRGGSWATAGTMLRRSFRNWYIPGYRQGFLGLRLAEDA